MNMVAEHLPLPVGARVAAPARRSKIDVWAAPDPAELVLDPWAAPVGLPVARTRVSPWSAPVASARVTWMPAPAALLPAPTALQTPALDAEPAPDAALATERAIATLRAFTRSPEAVTTPPTLGRLQPPVGSPLPAPRLASAPDALPAPSAATRAADDAPLPAFAPPHAGTAVRDRSSVARWRLVALVSGVGAATVAVVTLLASVL
ncbi:hypothetical protein [Ilumatobacter coccineus]|nr:hypothetical protein [Ilumatobacter coccineus]